MARLALFLLLSGGLLLVVACNGGGEAEPTSTATVVPPTPTEAPTPTATEVPPNVFGTLQVAFVPYGQNAVVPEPPLTVTLVIEPVGGGTIVEHQVTDAAKTFALDLPPGQYTVNNLVADSPALSDDPVDLLTGGGPGFTVPDSGCVYLGEITYSYYRLAPGDVVEQSDIAQQLSQQVGQEVFFTYLASGGLVPESAGVEVAQPPPGAESCVTQLARFE